MDHWCKNGSLKPACRLQRKKYREENREQININQNLIYQLKKGKLPTKVDRLVRAKSFALMNNGLCLSNEYLNCKTNLMWFCNIHAHIWLANWNNITSNNSWCPQCGQIKRENTCLSNHGVKNPSQDPAIRLKAARSASNIVEVVHWETGELIACQGSYEVLVCEYFNSKKITYQTQIKFDMPDNKTYSVDFYLPTSNIYIEVKGYMYPDAEEKWKWFHLNYANSELWDKDKLKQLKIL